MKLDVHWDDLPAEVKAWYIDQEIKAQAAEDAKPKPADPRAVKINYHPFGPKPLTRADGSVVHRHPQIPEWDQAYEAHCREQRAKLFKVTP